MDAFTQLVKAGIDCKLLILLLGQPQNEQETALEKEIFAMAGQALVSHHVLIHRVNNTELWPVLKKSALFIRPTKTDGDALSLREALYYQVPTVASDVVYRPEGTYLYSAGAKDALVSEMKKILLSDSIIPPGVQQSFYQEIVKVYE